MGDIAGQMATMVNTWGDIEAMKKANAALGPVPEGLSEEDRAEEVKKRRSSQYYQDVIGEYGTGSKTRWWFRPSVACCRAW
ncbi:hypothetical protein AAH446_05995 [Erwinia sp. P6884]|uniref:hypothetical protein n=1 Tax=Erwinia sp. P6884 TaxID=3141450 RepID=UPI003185CEA4